ncbi:MAG: ribosome biogenesis GTPase Der [Coriobacteriia bacterium]
MALPIVAVVGRPNVGKSTFVNRIAEARDAIVHETRGVTRDRSYHRSEWNGRAFMLVDTGGIESGAEDAFTGHIRKQVVAAAEEADAIVLLVDGTTGPLGGDAEVARMLKRGGKRVFLVVNKLDTPGREDAAHEFWSLGLGDPWPVSSLHGHGTGDLLDALVAALPEIPDVEEPGEIGVAIIGRPNAGKSSLLNRLCGVERAIVSEVAGTTRDAIDTVVERDGVRYRLVDTAGLRRASKIDDSVEYFGFVRAMKAIDRASVVLLMVDSTIGVTDQDQRVARFAEERGCAMVVLLNKWDEAGDAERKETLVADAAEKLQFVSFAPLLRVSALTGSGIDRVLDAVDTCYAAYTGTTATGALNRLLADLRAGGHTVSKGKATLRLAYATQTHHAPPGFTFFANHPRLVDDGYRRFLENRLRERFDLAGTPVILKFRSKE